MVGCRELWVGRMTPAASRRASGRAMPADDALRARDFTEKDKFSRPFAKASLRSAWIL